MPGSTSSATGVARPSAAVRALVHEAIPDVVEEWKWRGVPCWYHDGLVLTGESYKAAVKATFAKGASLDDPSGLFNSSLEGNTRRAIDFHEGDEIDAAAFKELVRAAAATERRRRASGSGRLSQALTSQGSLMSMYFSTFISRSHSANIDPNRSGISPRSAFRAASSDVKYATSVNSPSPK